MIRLLAVLLVALPACGLAPEPDAVGAQVADLARLADHLHVVPDLGRSHGGRSIPLVVATTRPDRLEEQLRVLVLARQHGDEATPGYAALLWLRAAATTPGRFRHVAVLLLPVVNPDGAAAGTRGNGAGVDLNRDWAARTQPETQAVLRAVARWRPHLAVDLHEFRGVVGGRRVQPDWVERYATSPVDRTVLDHFAADLLGRLVSRHRAVGEPVTAVVTRPGAATALCHRALVAREGLPSLLVEVGDGRADPLARLVSLLVEDLDHRAAVLKPRLDAALGLAGWRAPDDLAPATPRLAVDGQEVAPEPAPAPVSPNLGWVFGGYALVLLAGAKFRGEPADIL